ncbi:MAG: response regulator [Cytophagales bacterium]|uniref:Response regulatory domain-containing protein n=1 Tax=Algoriphagus taiwanensis TaxID=1445656 RepID=A0ABQ6Q1Z9_9BACT|nr:MAG: response regulator [Cytophagales bacterium]GMQ34196.1 hypothetical protein Ataiwa_24680 [Algoriphagus taiwanensis]
MNQSDNLLVVLDDDKIMHLLLRKRINLLGLVSDLKFFDQASDALNFLSEAPQAVVISDLNLGVMEAWEFLDSLFNQGFQGKFFLMSSSIINSDRVRANADPRVSGFFEKPLSETDLIQILQA